MASCPKCGKRRVRKNRFGFRKCRRCGVLRGIPGYDRCGVPRMCEGVEAAAVEKGET